VNESTAQPAQPSTREARGLALYRERGDEIKHVRGAVWSVPSCSREGVYLVDLAGGVCTCADMPPTGEVCKHTTAATISRAKSGICSGCSRRFRRRELVECVEGSYDGLMYFHGDHLCRSCADAAGVGTATRRRYPCCVPAWCVGARRRGGDPGSVDLHRGLVRGILVLARGVATSRSSRGAVMCFLAQSYAHLSAATGTGGTMPGEGMR
jgi:hypothetical protein